MRRANRGSHPAPHKASDATRLTPARKRFGQHFLEPAWVRKVVAAIDPQPHDTFIEIGPGRGALTRPLAERARRLVAYEIDRDLAAQLRAAAMPNVEIVEGDFLDAPGPDFSAPDPIRVAGNLPYNVASPILFKLVDWSRTGVALADATVMLQREVADRLLADPGSRDYGVLTVLLRHRASVERLLALPPGAFRPPPKIHSALVRLRFHAPDPPVDDEAAFERVVKLAFAQRRKTLANALSSQTARIQSDPFIDLGRRAETVTVAEYAALAKWLRNNT